MLDALLNDLDEDAPATDEVKATETEPEADHDPEPEPEPEPEPVHIAMARRSCCLCVICGSHELGLDRKPRRTRVRCWSSGGYVFHGPGLES